MKAAVVKLLPIFIVAAGTAFAEVDVNVDINAGRPRPPQVVEVAPAPVVERVWVPGETVVRKERVLVTPAHFEKRSEQVLVAPAHVEVREERVLPIGGQEEPQGRNKCARRMSNPSSLVLKDAPRWPLRCTAQLGGSGRAARSATAKARTTKPTAMTPMRTLRIRKCPAMATKKRTVAKYTVART